MMILGKNRPRFRWFILVEAHWLTAVCIEKKREGGQNTFEILALCQRPLLTHTSESLPILISSLNIKKWTLLIANSQLIEERVQKPKGRRAPRMWPLTWMREQNLLPEEWQWDVRNIPGSPSVWRLARIARHPLLTLIEPLKREKCSPTAVHAITAPSPPPIAKQWIDQLHTVTLQPKHLNEALQGAHEALINDSYDFLNNPLERARTKQQLLAFSALCLTVVVSVSSLFVPRTLQSPENTSGPLATATNVPVIEQRTVEKAEISEPAQIDCTSLQIKPAPIAAIYHTIPAQKFVVLAEQPYLKRYFPGDTLNTDWHLARIYTESVKWQHNHRPCSFTQALKSSESP